MHNEDLHNNKVLLILPEVPLSLRDSGISIRYIPLIESIYKETILDILVITKNSYKDGELSFIKKYCRKFQVITHNYSTVNSLDKILTRIKYLLPFSLPRSWLSYDFKNILRRTEDFVNNELYHSVICVSGYNYPYIHVIRANKVIVDFIDSPSVLAKRNVIGSKRSFLEQKYELLKTIWWESKVINKSDATLYISTYDVEYIPKFLAKSNKRFVIRNGYSCDDYTESRVDTENRPCIGFLGNMSYYPNIEAVLWLYNNIFPLLKESIPDLRMYIIGKNPDKSILELHNDDVVITGEVESIWPYLNSMSVMVFPIMRGAGVKNKILEAMYANIPVVTSSVGNEGIDATITESVYVCNSKEKYVNTIINLIMNSNSKTIKPSGRDFVINNFSWSEIVCKFKKVLFDN